MVNPETGVKEKNIPGFFEKINPKNAIGVVATLAVLTVPGIIAGWRDARQDQARLEEVELEYQSAQVRYSDSERGFTVSLENLPNDCESQVRAYLDGGKYEEFPDAAARIIIGQSDECKDESVDLVAELRDQQDRITESEASLDGLEIDLENKSSDAEANWEVVQYGIVGVPVVLGLTVGSVGVLMAFSKERYS